MYIRLMFIISNLHSNTVLSAILPIITYSILTSSCRLKYDPQDRGRHQYRHTIYTYIYISSNLESLIHLVQFPTGFLSLIIYLYLSLSYLSHNLALIPHSYPHIWISDLWSWLSIVQFITHDKVSFGLFDMNQRHDMHYIIFNVRSLRWWGDGWFVSQVVRDADFDGMMGVCGWANVYIQHVCACLL
jgi:hypothetical protein